MRSCQTCTNVEALTIIRYMPLSKRVPKLKEYASCTSFFLRRTLLVHIIHKNTSSPHLWLECTCNTPRRSFSVHNLSCYVHSWQSFRCHFMYIPLPIYPSIVRFSKQVTRKHNQPCCVPFPQKSKESSIKEAFILKEKRRIVCTIKRTPDTILSINRHATHSESIK